MGNPLEDFKDFAERTIGRFYAILGIAILIGVGICMVLARPSVDEICFDTSLFGKKVCLPGDPKGHIVLPLGTGATHQGVPGEVTLYWAGPSASYEDCPGTWVTNSPASTLPNGYSSVPNNQLFNGTSNPQSTGSSNPGYGFTVKAASCYIVGFEENSTGSTTFSDEFWEEPQNIHLTVVACNKNTGWEWVNGLANCP